MKLLIVRHAETNPDGNGFHQNGGVIGALSDKGKIQAELLANYLSTFRVGYIYSSDIPRAVATSYVISDSMPEVTVMLTKDLRIKNPDESLEDFKKRVTAFLEGLRLKYDNQTIVIVSHLDAIQILLVLLEYDKKIIPDLGSVSEFDIPNNADPIATRVNDTKYLK